MIQHVTAEIALAMLKNERLTWVDRRAAADDKIRTIDAQIAGAELVLKLQADAAERGKAASEIDETAAAVAKESELRSGVDSAQPLKTDD